MRNATAPSRGRMPTTKQQNETYETPAQQIKKETYTHNPHHHTVTAPVSYYGLSRPPHCTLPWPPFLFRGSWLPLPTRPPCSPLAPLSTPWLPRPLPLPLARAPPRLPSPFPALLARFLALARFGAAAPGYTGRSVARLVGREKQNVNESCANHDCCTTVEKPAEPPDQRVCADRHISIPSFPDIFLPQTYLTCHRPSW